MPHSSGEPDNKHNSDIEFLPDETHTPPASHKKNRTRNITWFNPPFSKNVKTNVGKKFLNLLDNHFRSTNPLSKIFNRNSIKITSGFVEDAGVVLVDNASHILQLLPPLFSHAWSVGTFTIFVGTFGIVKNIEKVDLK